MDFSNSNMAVPLGGRLIDNKSIGMLHTIDVGGVNCVTFEHNGEIWIYMREFLRNLNIMWNMQFVKIKEQLDVGIDRYKVRKFRIPSSNSSNRVVTCIPLETLQIFLFGISFMRMPTHERRLQIIWMQDNAAKIIEEYWGLQRQ